MVVQNDQPVFSTEDPMFLILAKYIEYVKLCEGVNYIDDLDRRIYYGEEDCGITDAEWKVLEMAAKFQIP